MERRRLAVAQKHPTLSDLERSDWKNEFPLECRDMICDQIAILFKKHLRCGNLYPSTFLQLAEEVEGEIFNYVAKSEADYLQNLIFKLHVIICCLQFKLYLQSANQTNMENSAASIGTYNPGLDWQAKTLEKISYLQQNYGKRFLNVYLWVKKGPHVHFSTSLTQRKRRSIIGPTLFQEYIPELEYIAQILQLTEKELISIRIMKSILELENQILYFIDAIEPLQEVYSKLMCSSPDEEEKCMLNELIKAYLMDKAKKLGVYINLDDDSEVSHDLAYSLKKEIVQIMNVWCYHKIRILTRSQPTMEETEKDLTIWQTPGSKLQQWCLLKHLPIKVRPVRQNPDPLFEKVRSIWKLELPSPPDQQLLQQQISPAWQFAVPNTQEAGLANYLGSLWQQHGAASMQPYLVDYLRFRRSHNPVGVSTQSHTGSRPLCCRRMKSLSTIT